MKFIKKNPRRTRPVPEWTKNLANEESKHWVINNYEIFHLEELISQMEPINTKYVVMAGVTMSTFAALRPFVMAYLRKRLTQDQLEKVFFQVMGDSGIRLVSRLASAAILGPIFAWWLLAKGVGAIVDMASPETAKPQKTTKLSFLPA